MASMAENKHAAALQEQLDEERASRFDVQRSNLRLQEQNLNLMEEAFKREKAARQTEARHRTCAGPQINGGLRQQATIGSPTAVGRPMSSAKEPMLRKPVEVPRKHSSDMLAAAAGACVMSGATGTQATGSFYVAPTTHIYMHTQLCAHHAIPIIKKHRWPCGLPGL